MILSETLEKAHKLRWAIDEYLPGLVVPGEKRARLFYGFMHLSLEHFGAISVLLESRFSASAAAMLRPQYEAVIRAIYFYEYAEEKAVNSFLAGKEPVRIADMINIIEAKEGAGSNALRKFYDRFKKCMNGFTHGGFAQIQRRFTEKDLMCNFSDQEQDSIGRVSLLLAEISAVCVASVAERHDLISKFHTGFNIDENSP